MVIKETGEKKNILKIYLIYITSKNFEKRGKSWTD